MTYIRMHCMFDVIIKSSQKLNFDIICQMRAKSAILMMTSHLSKGVGAVNLNHHSATPKTLLKMIDHSWKKASELSFCLF